MVTTYNINNKTLINIIITINVLSHLSELIITHNIHIYAENNDHAGPLKAWILFASNSQVHLLSNLGM